MREGLMDVVYRPAALDRGDQGVLGRAVPRVDGPAKVTGGARYTAEHAPAGLCFATVIGAPVARGRVTRIDAGAALAMPGVLAVISDDPRLPAGEASSRAMPKQGGDTVVHLGQPVAVLVAETAAIAAEAARLVVVEMDEAPGVFDPHQGAVERDHKLGFLPGIDKGDLDAALRDAAVVFDESYTTPVHFAAALEPHATIAWWEDGHLTVRVSNQIIGAARATIATALGIAPDRVRALAPFIGGGFGGKTTVGPDAIIAAIAAERVGRPVKLVVPRRQIAYLGHHRADTVQRLRLACDDEGRIDGIGHESVVPIDVDGGFVEPVPFGTFPLYRGAARRLRTDIVRVHRPETGAVRAPGEAVGSLALECAMDELAHRLGLDPIELRRRNEPDVDPLSGKRFSTRRLLDCYTDGARAFGWDLRDPIPGARREGEWLIGLGMAAALRGNFTVGAEVRVRLEPDARAVVETDMTDIGTGTYTILAQVAGEMLGLPIDAVEVRLGDSDLPRSAGSGGSFGASSAGAAVALACEELLVELALRMNAAPEELRLKDARVAAGGREVALAELLRGEALVATGKAGPGKETQATSQASHGAQFAEVAVNAVTGEVRVRRMLGVFDVGRVLNAATARSQIIGGMAWGLSYALIEAAEVDTRDGRFINPDFGEYHVATSADVPAIECRFIEEVDASANQVGAKGVGELGIAGAGAAVANAVFNACGVRVREFPITPDKLLVGLPAV